MSSHQKQNRELVSSPSYYESGFSVPFRDASPDSNEQPLADLDQFVVPGRDEHGGHQSVTFNATPALVHEIDVAVRSNLFPYINREALVRHALVRHLRWLGEIRHESLGQHIAPAIEGIIERCFEVQMQKKIKHAFEALHEQILACEQAGEHMEVIRLVNYVQARLKAVGGGSVWQQRAWKRFINEFGVYFLPEHSKAIGVGAMGKPNKKSTVAMKRIDTEDTDADIDTNTVDTDTVDTVEFLQ